MQPPLTLTPSLQHYAWGDLRYLQALLALETADATQPCAEAWYGAHPRAPARVEGRPLDGLLAKHPAWLHPEAPAELSYLLKILAARQPLSIQVHPDAQQAAEGFARENAIGVPLDAPHRSYRDPNPKPELFVALTPFHALCGFCEPAELRRRLERLPALQAALPPFEASSAGVRQVLRAYFSLEETQLRPLVAAFLAELRGAEPAGGYAPEDLRYWVLRAAGRDAAIRPADRGLILVYLMRLVKLAPGEGLFVPAGVPHAYLEGAGVELMPNSDNVLRAGLTQKHVDPAALLEVLRPEAVGVGPLAPHYRTDAHEAFYELPDAPFALSCFELAPGESVERRAAGAETLLVIGDAPARLRVQCAEQVRTLCRGEACLLPHAVSYRMEAMGAPLRVFRARASDVVSEAA